MIYPSFDELWSHYGKERSEMSYEEETKCVNDCFDTYEHLGFADTFQTPFSDFQSINGNGFTVIRRMSTNDPEQSWDLESLPAWLIKTDDGILIPAFPEEICLAERSGGKI